MRKKLSEQATIDPTAHVLNTTLGSWTEIGPNNRIMNSHIGDYSYSGRDCIFQNAHIGKFSNIAACVRIGATDHPIHRPTLHHFTYRKSMFGLGEDDEEFLDTGPLG